MMKKIVVTLLAAVLALSLLSACALPAENPATPVPPTGEPAAFDTERQITVLSREEGSGTRGAFTELFGIEQKNEAGEKVDMTTPDAAITNNTAVMMTTVAGNPYAIGYISLGSLDDSVKALAIDGVAPSVENIKNGTYKVARPFLIVTGESLSVAAADFSAYILSAEGQAVIEGAGYIAAEDQAAAFETNGAEGTVVVAGSSSVTPVMEKLKEAYAAVNPNVKIEIQLSDSTTGITAAIDGVCDIGMASRELKEREQATGVAATTIAMDGIAIIVNQENPLTELAGSTVQAIYTGELLRWNEVINE